MAASEWETGPKQRYPSDLTDEEWAILQPFVPAKVKGDGRRGQPTAVDLREICYAIFYAKWRDDGTWDQINQALAKHQRVEADGRQAEPTGAILDSQSVKTTSMGAERGYDGGKKLNGRKRVVLTDAAGNLLKASVLPASVSEVGGGAWLCQLACHDWRQIKIIRVDAAYRGDAFAALVRAAYGEGVKMEVVQRAEGEVGIATQPRRWVVEQTNAWFISARRLAKDDERLPETSEAFICLASTRIFLRNIAAH